MVGFARDTERNSLEQKAFSPPMPFDTAIRKPTENRVRVRNCYMIFIANSSVLMILRLKFSSMKCTSFLTFWKLVGKGDFNVFIMQKVGR